MNKDAVAKRGAHFGQREADGGEDEIDKIEDGQAEHQRVKHVLRSLTLQNEDGHYVGNDADGGDTTDDGPIHPECKSENKNKNILCLLVVQNLPKINLEVEKFG